MDKYDHLDIDVFLTYLDYMIRYEDIDLEDQGGTSTVLRRVPKGPQGQIDKYMNCMFTESFIKALIRLRELALPVCMCQGTGSHYIGKAFLRHSVLFENLCCC